MNESSITEIVRWTPIDKRHYYEDGRFSLESNRSDRSGKWKKIVVRVAENLATVDEFGRAQEADCVILVAQLEKLS
jgi:hypothetical protein